MKSREKKLSAVIDEIRICFNQLKTLAEHLHQDLGVNPSMRAVIESISVHGPQTVPDIANRKRVSRQHIQNIVNGLQAEDFVAAFENPAHKRSPLFDLTSKGLSVFAELQARERKPLRRLAKSLSAEQLDQAASVLMDLNEHLAIEISEGENQ